MGPGLRRGDTVGEGTPVTELGGVGSARRTRSLPQLERAQIRVKPAFPISFEVAMLWNEAVSLFAYIDTGRPNAGFATSLAAQRGIRAPAYSKDRSQG